MKKYLGYSLSIFFIITTAFVTSKKGNANAIKSFNETFKNVQQLRWFDTTDYSTVYFEKNNIRSKVTYDKKGQFISSLRYYDEDHLPLNVLLALKEKYKGKNIIGVTESMDAQDILYYVVLEDDKFPL